ncbi:hypothetical protein GIB67_030407, partial [Kingdonia uniflora]
KFIKKNGECINYFKPSSIWPGLKGVMNYVKNNSRWQIGNGCTIDFWRDCWGADLPVMKEVSVESKIWGICSAKLNSIIDQTGWNAPPLVAEFLTDHGIDLRNLDVDYNLNDKRVWRHHPQGAFTVQSAHEAIRSKNPKNLVIFKEERFYGNKIKVQLLALIKEAASLLDNCMNNSVLDLQIISKLGVQVRARPLPRIASCRWTLPWFEEIKINCNGSTLGNPGKAGLGLIARNHSGDVLGVRTKGLGVLSRPDAECYAIVGGNELGYGNGVAEDLD